MLYNILFLIIKHDDNIYIYIYIYILYDNIIRGIHFTDY